MKPWVGLLLMLVALVGACSRKAEAPAGPEPNWVKGKIVSVNAADKTVTIDHEDIPGLMPAMTMTFTVQDAKLLEGVAAGLSVSIRRQAAEGLSAPLKAMGWVPTAARMSFVISSSVTGCFGSGCVIKTVTRGSCPATRVVRRRVRSTSSGLLKVRRRGAASCAQRFR